MYAIWCNANPANCAAYDIGYVPYLAKEMKINTWTNKNNHGYI